MAREQGQGMVVKSRIGAVMALAVLTMSALVGGCSSIVNHRGYITDQVLMQSVQPGIDNRQSVERTLGRPSAAMARKEAACRKPSATRRRRNWNRREERPFSRRAGEGRTSEPFPSMWGTGLRRAVETLAPWSCCRSPWLAVPALASSFRERLHAIR